MPTRTVTEELCDVCFGAEKQKETPATERFRFSWMGKDYLLLACNKHVAKIRDQLQHVSELGALEQKGAARARRAPVAARNRRTLFSTLTGSEKERFRSWSGLPTARRIADTRVEEWIAAGKP